MKTSFFRQALVMFALLACGLVRGQVVEKWIQNFPNYRSAGTSMVVDSEGNVFVAGQSLGMNGHSVITTAKHNGTTGALIWYVNHYSETNGDEVARNIAIDPDDNVYVTGTVTNAAGNLDAYTVKYDTNGNALWERTYDRVGKNDGTYGIAVDSTGDVVVVGIATDTNELGDLYVAKYAGDTGELRWQTFYDGPAHLHDYGFAVVLDAEDNIFVTGGSEQPPNGFQSNPDFLTLKYSPAGVEVWSDRHDGPDSLADFASAIAIDPDGDVVITGHSHNGIDYDIMTVKYQAVDLSVAWVHRYSGTNPGSSEESPTGLAFDPAGNVVITGFTGTGQYETDIYTAKYAASDGSILWSVTYDGPAGFVDEGDGVAVDSAGNVYITGTTMRLAPGLNTDFYTAAYSGADGSLLWEKLYNGPGNAYDGMSWSGDNIQHTHRIVLTPDGGVAVTGFAAMDSFGSSAMTTIKYGPPFHEIEVASPAETILVSGSSEIGYGDTVVDSVSPAKTFTVRNLGDENLSGLDVTITGDTDNFYADFSNVIPVLPPGGSFTFTVDFEPQSTGSKNATLHIASDDADENPFNIDLTGTGILAPDILVEDPFGADFAFGGNYYYFPQPVVSGGSSEPSEFTIRNTGNDVLHIGDIALTGSDAVHFSFDDSSLDAELAPGESTTLNITFNPQTPGEKGATLSIPSDDPDEPSYDIALYGSSPQPPPPYEVRQEGVEEPLATGSVVFCGAVRVGRNGTAVNFTVTNTSAADIANLLVSVEGGEGGSPGDFILTTDPIPNPLAPAGSFNFSATFHPTAEGFRYATLVVRVGPEDGNPYQTTLFGVGYPPGGLLYADWAANVGLEGDDAAATATPFSDGVPNLLKYAFNLDATGPDVTVLTPGTGLGGLPVWSLVGDGPSRMLRVEFVQRRDASASYAPEVSEDLENFRHMMGPTTIDDIGGGWDRVSIQEPADPMEYPRLLGRVKVQLEDN